MYCLPFGRYVFVDLCLSRLHLHFAGCMAVSPSYGGQDAARATIVNRLRRDVNSELYISP